MKNLYQHLLRSAAWLVAAGIGLGPATGRAQGIPVASASVPEAPQQAASSPPGTPVSIGFGSPAASQAPAPAPTGSLPGPATADSAEPAGEEEVLSEADLICVVGSEHILAGDMRIIYEPYIEELLGRITPSQEKMLRQRYTREALKQYVSIKALYLEFFRVNAGNVAPKELKETQQKVLTRANKVFFEEQVPNLLKSHKVSDLKGLEEKLRAKSMSVNQVRQQFVERILASEVERRSVPKEVEIAPDELIKYYDEHAKDWDKPGRAKWRQLTARFDRFSAKEAARAAIVAMGNEVYLGGKPFDAVAREQSQGFTAEKGGLVDWTTQGSLKSTQLDQAIFSIPLMRLSEIIEDDIGFHIIEVLEREDATTLSFEAAQEDMRKAITKTKTEQLREAFHRKVMERTVIWTRWPEDIPGSRSLSEVLEDSPLTSAEPSR